MGKTSFYLSKDLEKKLRIGPERGLSMAANRAIDRYYAMCDAERAKLEKLFSEGEWNAMRNATNGTIWEPAGVIRNGMLAEIQDTIDEELEFYKADRKKLEKKLIELNVSQQFALVEMLEEWWSRQ
jgi:hypothetical protein